MAIKIIEAKEFDDRINYICTLDDSKIDSSGNPLPDYLVEYNWGKDVSEENRLSETALLCQAKLSELQGATLKEQGQVLIEFPI